MKRNRNILIGCVVFVAIAIIAFMGGFLCLLYQNHEILASNPGEVLQFGLLEAGLAIITLVVTVWASLGIINYLNKEDVENATKAAKAAAFQNNIISEKVNKLSDDVASMEATTGLNLFLYKLSSKDDAVADYFLKQFRDVFSTNPHPEDLAPVFSKLIDIEQLNTQIGELHSNADRSSPILLGKANELRKIKKSVEDILTNDTEKEALIRNYLEIREAYSYFFSGYAYEKRSDHSEAISAFQHAAQSIQSVVERVFPVFKNYCGEDARTKCFDGDEFDEKLCIDNCDKLLEFLENNSVQYRFILTATNTIGESHNKILYRKMQILDQGAKKHELASDWKDDWKLALFYFTTSVHIAEETGLTTETYYRNFGCAYERYARLILIKNAEDKAEALEKYKAALKYYNEAFQTESERRGISHGGIQSVFKVLLSCYDRVIRLELGFDPMPQKELRFTREVESALDPKCDRWNDIIIHIQQFREYAKIAADRIPSEKLHHTMRGTANLWMLLAMHGCGFVSPSADKVQLLREIEESIKTAELHGATKDDDYYYSLIQGLKLIN